MRIFSAPAFTIKNGIATCKMGMTPEKVVDIRFEFEFIPEKEFEIKRSECWKSAGLPDSGASLTEMESK